MFIVIPVILLLIMLSSFFAAAEMAFVSVNRVNVREKSVSGEKNALLLEHLLEEPDEVISAIVIGNNLANITASVLAGAVATALVGHIGVGIATAVMTLIIVIFGEAVPKAYGIHNESFAFRVARLLYLVHRLFLPVVKVFSVISDVLLKLLGKEHRKRAVVTEEEVKTLIALGVHEGTIQKDEQKLVEEIFEFDETKVAEVRVPYEKVVSLPESGTVADLIALAAETGYSRFPIYRADKADLVGVVLVKDALLKPKSAPLTELMRDLLRISPGTKADDLLREMQRKKVHMAVIQSPMGRPIGLVTLEDLIEEVFGEIRDEHDLK
ncbi:MAG TPA: HlyC/CorC family transporter [Methanomicrobia archaeon]|nr:HlyC/CorC family transporter [Methanomicrobia archaeon]